MGGEFYTPTSIVRLMVEILEPFEGRVLDPACGSGGMFVQSARFVAEHKKAGALSIHGIEKVDDTGRSAASTSRCTGSKATSATAARSTATTTTRTTSSGASTSCSRTRRSTSTRSTRTGSKRLGGEGRRFPFGVPKPDNANYLWIQIFYAALNAQGRAGFVMANSASDARARNRSCAGNSSRRALST
jgi:type I restriction enzyme M protein